MPYYVRKLKYYLGLIFLVFLISGCVTVRPKPRDFTFPKNFLWGAATSSHQAEGNNISNDWWEWESRLPLIMRSGQASDQWNRFEEDSVLMQSLGLKAYRFSIEWSRIEPEEDKFDIEALEHYRQVILSLKSKGIEPVVVLEHFTLPLWLARQGGWSSGKTPEIFSRYVQKVTEALGSEVHYWITLNEPVVHAFRGYMIGDWPPGEQSLKKAIKVLENLLLGHVLAYGQIKEIHAQKGWKIPLVGIAQNVLVFRGSSKYSLLDWAAARFISWLYNHAFVQALVRGKIYCIGLFDLRLPKAKTLDFIGLNYYTRAYIISHGLKPPEIFIKQYKETAGQQQYVGKDNSFSFTGPKRYAGKDNFLSWESYPLGLYVLLKDFNRYKLPILVSENGVATKDDAERQVFIIEHLRMVVRAMQEGVSVIGYLYWSLIDIYEWNKGLAPQFGLIEVNHLTQERKIRPSARKFAQIISSGKLDP